MAAMDEHQESGYFRGMSTAEAIGVLLYVAILAGVVIGVLRWLL